MTAFMPLAMEKDLRCDLMATGSGSLSIRCTGVQETMERQHRSWRLKTEKKEKWMLNIAELRLRIGTKLKQYFQNVQHKCKMTRSTLVTVLKSHIRALQEPCRKAITLIHGSGGFLGGDSPQFHRRTINPKLRKDALNF